MGDLIKSLISRKNILTNDYAVFEIQEQLNKSQLLAIMTILAGEKFSNTLITKYIRREILMNSPIYNQWVEEERKEAAEKATAEAIKRTTRDNLIYLLESRFEFIPKDIKETIKTVDDISILKGLMKNVLTIGSIEDFEEFLNKVRNLNK